MDRDKIKRKFHGVLNSPAYMDVTRYKKNNASKAYKLINMALDLYPIKFEQVKTEKDIFGVLNSTMNVKIQKTDYQGYLASLERSIKNKKKLLEIQNKLKKKDAEPEEYWWQRYE